MNKNVSYTYNHQHPLPQRQQRNVVRILVIASYEKNESFEQSLKTVFEQLPYHNIYYLTKVSKLKTALESLQNNIYKAILLDTELLDDASTAQISALYAKTPDTPIIVFSSANDAKSKTRSLQHGASYFIVKGTECADLLKEILANVFI